MLNRIRILYTIPNFDTAGSGKVVYDLAKGLDKSKFEVIIACKHNKGEFYKTVETLGVPVYFIDATTPIRPYYTFLKRLHPFKSFLKEHKIDVVHSWHWSSDWSEVLACRLMGIPFVYTKKAMGWGNVHWKIKSYLSNFIITVNSDMRNFFPYKKRQQLIPFGLDTEFYNPESVPKPTGKSEFKIVTVANLVPVKGIETLIKALSMVNPIIKLDIIGDTRDPYAASLQNMVIDLKFQERVRFLGKQADVRKLLVAADLYVIPSKQEGMPMALVEAMCMGLPVLGADVPGIRDLLKDFKEYMFPGSDSEALAHKIEIIFNKPAEEREALGMELREYCLSHFGMSQFVRSHEILYQDLNNAR